MEKIIKELELKVKSGTIEVEDILQLANSQSTEVSNYLKKLSAELGWLDLENAEKASKVPLGDWASVVTAYLDGGFEALSDMVKVDLDYIGKSRLIVALLEYLHNEQSVSALIDIFGDVLDLPENNIMFARRIATTLNLLLSFDPKITLASEKKDRIRIFLHQLLNNRIDDDFRALVYCALRNTGNEESVSRIKKFKKLGGEWSGTEKLVIKSIKNSG